MKAVAVGFGLLQDVSQEHTGEISDAVLRKVADGQMEVDDEDKEEPMDHDGQVRE